MVQARRSAWPWVVTLCAALLTGCNSASAVVTQTVSSPEAASSNLLSAAPATTNRSSPGTSGPPATTAASIPWPADLTKNQVAAAEAALAAVAGYVKVTAAANADPSAKDWTAADQSDDRSPVTEPVTKPVRRGDKKDLAPGECVALLLLIMGIRGVRVSPGRPTTRTARLLRLLRSPAVSGRIAAGVGVFAATLVFTRWQVAAAGLGALVVTWPVLFGGTRAEQQRIARLEALVVWTEALRDTIAAHASLEQAIPATAGNASPVIRPALVRLVGQIRARVPMDKALLNLAAELDDASADLVIAALILNVRRRGDRLGEVLSGLAAAAREELDMRRRVSAGRAEIRRGAQIVVLITIAFTVFLVMFGGTYVEPYNTGAGQVALVVVVAMFAAGFAWMRKLSGSAPAQPFLIRPGRPVDPAEVTLVATLTGRADQLTPGRDTRR